MGATLVTIDDSSAEPLALQNRTDCQARRKSLQAGRLKGTDRSHRGHVGMGNLVRDGHPVCERSRAVADRARDRSGAQPRRG